MEALESIKHALSCLPFFSASTLQISQVASGQSHACFNVFDGKRRYLAKYIGDRDASQEVGALQVTSASGLAPQVCFVDKQWIISDFIDSPNLSALLQNGECDKAYAVSTLIEAMVNCHLHQADITPFNFTSMLGPVADDFISEPSLNVISALVANLHSHAKPSKYVLCHGDLNFSNILINSTTGEYALIDYECCGYAEPEFDMAMMMAINQISHVQLAALIDQYHSKMSASLTKLDLKKVTRYLSISYYINSLWYFDKYKETRVNSYLVQAKEQRNLLDLQIADIKKGSF